MVKKRERIRKEKIKLICKECGKEFMSNKKNQLYCKSKCRMAYWLKLHPRITIQENKG